MVAWRFQCGNTAAGVVALLLVRLPSGGLGASVVEFRILGPVEVVDDDGRELSLAGTRQRALLALLLLHANELVSRERLIEELWGEGTPASAAKALQVHVSRLRRVLGGGEGGALATGPGGYVLRVEPEQLDAAVFEGLLTEARGLLAGGDPSAAGRRLRQALGLWRGSPLGDLALMEFAQPEIRRLEELRLVAVMERIDSDLALGAGAELIGELEKLIASDPLQERLRAQLMRALYRAGRQADALEVYRQMSELLREQLGLEPGPALQDLERSILQQEAVLEPTCRAEPTPTGNLPRAATTFLGRGRELAYLGSLLRTGARLLTLTGAGGSGKTRLALRLAEERAGDYRDGAWYVGCADITNPELLAPTICQALGVAEQPGIPAAQRLHSWLADREMLLLVDNLEQLTEAAARLSALLHACPDVTLLATSREPLHLAGEQQFDVPVLAHEDAIELFIARGRAVAPTLNPDPELAGRICERLDCLPLAIELAAARTKALSLAEILARLDTRLPLLTGGPRDAPQRQRTLRATLDWSYQLLNPDEQQLFARLAVFAGGFTLNAAETVCGAELDTLQALLDRSLVRKDNHRYWMLQTLREYALERLRQTSEEHHLRSRHAQYFVQLLDATGLQPYAWPHESALRTIAPERENLRGALAWASSNGETIIVARLASKLSHVWIAEGQLAEARRWIGIARKHECDYQVSLTAQVLSAARALATHRGDPGEAAALAERALASWREVGDPDGIGREMVAIAAIRSEAGDLAGARTMLEAVIALARAQSLTQLLPTALVNLAELAIAEERFQEGRALSEEALAVAGESHSMAGTVALINLAYLANRGGRHRDAEDLGRHALDAALRRGDGVAAAWTAMIIAWSLADQDQAEPAARLLGACTAFLKAAGSARFWMDQACETAALAALHTRLDECTIQAMLDEGRGMSLEEAIQEAPLRSAAP